MTYTCSPAPDTALETTTPTFSRCLRPAATGRDGHCSKRTPSHSATDRHSAFQEDASTFYVEQRTARSSAAPPQPRHRRQRCGQHLQHALKIATTGPTVPVPRGTPGPAHELRSQIRSVQVGIAVPRGTLRPRQSTAANPEAITSLSTNPTLQLAAESDIRCSTSNTPTHPPNPKAAPPSARRHHCSTWNTPSTASAYPDPNRPESLAPLNATGPAPGHHRVRWPMPQLGLLHPPAKMKAAPLCARRHRCSTWNTPSTAAAYGGQTRPQSLSHSRKPALQPAPRV